MTELTNQKFYSIEKCDKTEQVLALKWKDTTAKMTDQDFKDTLTELAKVAAKNQTPYLVIDTLNFKHQFEDVQATMGWRAQNIIPQYKSAGVVKEAFLIPEGAPKIQAEHDDLKTDSFTSDDDIKNWLFN